MNNQTESDHGKLKRLIKPTLGFTSVKIAYATIKGFEVMWYRPQSSMGETRFIKRQFGIFSS